MSMCNWKKRFDVTRKSHDGQTNEMYFRANCDVVRDTLGGIAAYAGGTARAAVSVVVNMPAYRAARFMKPQSRGSGFGRYENRYSYSRRVGQPLNNDSAREQIDRALADIDPSSALSKRNGHYAAMELNGTGIRYFGDICLVLKPDIVDDETLTLQRNSYEVRVRPSLDRYDKLSGALQRGKFLEILHEWAGRWAKDGVLLAACKIMETHPPQTRRMTTGTVSDRVLEDEDYIELIMSHGFGRRDVAELRLTAEDAASEALIGDQARVGLTPTASQALWRFRRRVATLRARGIGIPVRVVTTTGRSR